MKYTGGTKYPNGENVFNPDGSFNPPSDPEIMVFPGHIINLTVDAVVEKVWKDLEKKRHLSDVEFVNQNARGK